MSLIWMIKLVFLIADALFVLLVFVVLLVVAFRTLFIGLEFGWERLTAPLSLHPAAESFKVLTLLLPFLELFVVSGALLRHFENVPVCLVVLASEGEVLPLQTLGLLGHLLHLFAESEEELIAVIQSVLHLIILADAHSDESVDLPA